MLKNLRYLYILTLAIDLNVNIFGVVFYILIFNSIHMFCSMNISMFTKYNQEALFVRSQYKYCRCFTNYVFNMYIEYLQLFPKALLWTVHNREGRQKLLYWTWTFNLHYLRFLGSCESSVSRQHGVSVSKESWRAWSW